MDGKIFTVFTTAQRGRGWVGKKRRMLLMGKFNIARKYAINLLNLFVSNSRKY